MKTIEQLKQLQNNPFYTLTDEEQQRLNAVKSQEEAVTPEASTYPKVVSSSKGNAAVKETGSFDIHSTSYTTE